MMKELKTISAKENHASGGSTVGSRFGGTARALDRVPAMRCRTTAAEVSGANCGPKIIFLFC
jgi:hypothetical protein